MAPGMRAALVGIALAALAGCSTLQRQDYYAPASASGTLVEGARSRCGSSGGHSLTGPPSRILLTRLGVTLGLEVSPLARRTVSAGPLVLPVLPALPPSAFPQLEGGRGQPLALVLRVLEPVDSSELDLDRLVITIESERGRAISYEPADTIEEFVPFEDAPSEWQLADGLELTHRWGSGEPRSFRVRISGIALEGEPVIFPAVSFRRARGWVVCEESLADLTREARGSRAPRAPPPPAPPPR